LPVIRAGTHEYQTNSAWQHVCILRQDRSDLIEIAEARPQIHRFAVLKSHFQIARFCFELRDVALLLSEVNK
jgi:hypothetical protein